MCSFQISFRNSTLIINLVNSPVVVFSTLLFKFSLGFFAGPDATVKTLLPTILKIYNQLNKEAYLRHCDDEIIKSVVEILYDKYFLVQLLSRLGLSVFLEHFSRPLAECVVTNTSCAGKYV